MALIRANGAPAGGVVTVQAGGTRPHQESATELVTRKLREASPDGRLASERAGLSSTPTTDDVARLTFRPPTPAKSGAEVQRDIRRQLGTQTDADGAADRAARDAETARHYQRMAERERNAVPFAHLSRSPAAQPVALTAADRARKTRVIDALNVAPNAGHTWYLADDGAIRRRAKTS